MSIIPHLKLIHPSTLRSSKWPLSLKFPPPEPYTHLFYSQYVLYVPPVTFFWFDRPNKIWSGVRIVKFLILLSSPLFSLPSSVFSPHLFLSILFSNTPSPCSVLYVRDQASNLYNPIRNITCIQSVTHNNSFISWFTATCSGSNCEPWWGLLYTLLRNNDSLHKKDISPITWGILRKCREEISCTRIYKRRDDGTQLEQKHASAKTKYCAFDCFNTDTCKLLAPKGASRLKIKEKLWFCIF